MKKKSILSLGLSSILVLSLLTACGSPAATTATPVPEPSAPAVSEPVSGISTEEIGVRQFRLGTNNSNPHPLVQSAEHFGKVLSELTDGKMTLTVYDGGQLGDKATQIQMLQTGALDFYTCGNGTLADLGPSNVAAFSLPYLFDNMAHARAYVQSDDFQDMMDYVDNANIGVHSLGVELESGRCWFAKKELTSHPDCLHGMKLRSQEGTIYTLTGEAFGAQITSVAFSELYSALQSGVVDGADQPLSGFVSNQFPEICKYFIMDEHEIPLVWTLISSMTWDSLNDAEKAAVQEAFNQSVDFFYEVQDSLTEEYITSMKESGVNIIEIDPAEWKAAVSSIYDEYPQYNDIVKAVQATEY